MFLAPVKSLSRGRGILTCFPRTELVASRRFYRTSARLCNDQSGSSSGSGDQESKPISDETSRAASSAISSSTSTAAETSAKASSDKSGAQAGAGARARAAGSEGSNKTGNVTRRRRILPRFDETSRSESIQVGDYQISVEGVDESEMARRREINDRRAQWTLRANDPYVPPKEDVIISDNNPDVIDTLLDHPSKVDRRIADMQGKHLVEFDSKEDLKSAKEKQGVVERKRMTPSDYEAKLAKKRPPAIRKNQFGAKELALLYEKQAPKDQSTTKFVDPLKRLKYLAIYPPKVRRWITYLRHCKGRYNQWGYWENDSDVQAKEDIKREQLIIRARNSNDTSYLQLMEERKLRHPIPLDLEGHYRFGVQPEELVGVHPKVKSLLTFAYANNSEVNAFRKQQLIKRFQERPNDHGTPQVQIAMMTMRIQYLSEHLTRHRKDQVSRYRLRLLIQKRHSLLRYLAKRNAPVYCQLVKEMNIGDAALL